MCYEPFVVETGFPTLHHAPPGAGCCAEMKNLLQLPT